MRFQLAIISLLVALAPMSSVLAQRQTEKLQRGVVAVKSDRGVFVSWRLLGTDPDSVAFNVYRRTKAGSELVRGMRRRFSEPPR